MTDPSTRRQYVPPTQREIRDRGECGHDYQAFDGSHCGRESKPGAQLGYCREHDTAFRESVRNLGGPRQQPEAPARTRGRSRS